MKQKHVSFLASFTLLMFFSFAVTGCDTKTENTQVYRTQAQTAITDLQHTLKDTLTQTIKTEGIEAGIEVCTNEAHSLTHSISKKHKLILKRTSHKTRNPKNTPSKAEKKGLSRFLKAEKEGSLSPKLYFEQDVKIGNKKYYHYMKPIITQPKCLMCHGQNIAPSLSKKISLLYPTDQATGFKAGQLRGAFSVLIQQK